MVLKPGTEDTARAIFEKWELDFAVVGQLTESGHMVLTHKGEIVADLPIDPLALASPEYDRPWVPTPKANEIDAASIPVPGDMIGTLKALLSCPNMASKRWIWEQYDHMVMGDTMGIGRPGGDAALVRVHGTDKALAMTSDCTPRYCFADPVEGGRQVVAETWRNLTATGATPMAVTDNMNFGNPEKPEIMGQFVGCIEGMKEACLALDFPVVSGNVSLYNETNGQAILPTPTIGAVGLLEDASRAIGMGFVADGESIVIIGETKGHLGASLYLREIEGREEGSPPPVDLKTERLNGDFVREQILSGQISACHDVSDGGLLITIAEMALAGNTGCAVNSPENTSTLHAWAFGEDQARYIITTSEADALISSAKAAGVSATIIGSVGGDDFVLSGHGKMSVAELHEEHENWLPAYMAGNP